MLISVQPKPEAVRKAVERHPEAKLFQCSHAALGLWLNLGKNEGRVNCDPPPPGTPAARGTIGGLPFVIRPDLPEDLFFLELPD